VTAKFIVTPGGEKLAVLPADEYEDMRDALLVLVGRPATA